MTAITTIDREIATEINELSERLGHGARTTPNEVASVRANRDNEDTLRMWSSPFVTLVFKTEMDVTR